MSKTNLEKITEACESGSPLNQIVIMQAIDKYCEQVLEIETAPHNWTSGIISWEAWQDAARDVQNKIK